MQPGHDHRTQLQVERIIFFSDAVFAIAITLLVIEIKIPELHDPVSEKELLTAVFRLLPRFLGFVISFVIIGLYWTRHHFIFNYVVTYTSKLLWLNLFLLLAIALMPFSTGLFGEYSTPRTMHLRTPLIIYVLNISFVGLMNFLMARYIGNPANGVADTRLDREEVKELKRRAAIVPAVFLLAIPVAFINGYLARYVPLLLPIGLRLFRRRRAPD
ncbi:MAG: DUF1211 domain-containing protein [Acidobacteria bacterium]|nr:MAG: DUF1211 domain-containing protein [Acidobacteriota bacterium]